MELVVGVVLLWVVLGGTVISVLALLHRFLVDDPPARGKPGANGATRGLSAAKPNSAPAKAGSASLPQS